MIRLWNPRHPCGPRTLQSRRKTNDYTPRRGARLSVRRSLYDFKSNAAVLPRCDRAYSRANRFCDTALLADHPSEVFPRNPQLEHRGGLALRLLHLRRIGIVYQLLRDELNELLHGVIPLKKSKGSFYKPVASRYLIREFIGGFERLAITCVHGDADKRSSPG